MQHDFHIYSFRAATNTLHKHATQATSGITVKLKRPNIYALTPCVHIIIGSISKMNQYITTNLKHCILQMLFFATALFLSFADTERLHLNIQTTVRV